MRERPLHGLPQPVFGRGAHLLVLRRLCRPGRLVTIVGPPGIGKTTLARLFLARQSVAKVVRCELAEVHDAPGLVAAVASMLGLPLGSRLSLAARVRRVAEALSGRDRLVLFLDNFEQLVAHAETLGVWRSAAPRTTLLVTSRQALDLDGERVLKLPPLALPDEDALEITPAVTLFLDRARRAGSDLQGDADALAAIGRIVRALDGIPLAIELAAARTRVLGLDELGARLPALALLRRPEAPPDDRHATLRAAILWSWRLLAPWEQEALRQCAVFRGGFTLAAAEAVIDLGGVPGAPPVADAVQGLLDKNLLRSARSPVRSGEVRLAPYVSVRELAAEMLAASPDAGQVAARHAAHYLELGLACARRSEAEGGVDSLARLELERENLVAVFERAREAPDPMLDALRAAVALHPLLSTRGPAELHVATLEPVTGAAVRDVPVELAAAALFARAAMERTRDRWDEAGALYDEGARRATAAGRDDLLAHARIGAGSVHRHFGRFPEAEREYRAAQPLASRTGARGLEGIAENHLGCVMLDQARAREAEEHFERALAIHREVGNRRMEAIDLGNLGRVQLDLARLEAARSSLERAVNVHREVGNRRIEGIDRAYLGMVELERRALGPARRHLDAALRALRSTGDLMYSGLALGALGTLEAMSGRADRARATFDQADHLLRLAGDDLSSATLTVHRGHLDLLWAGEARAVGDDERARAHERDARLRLERARAAAAPDVPAAVSVSDDVRWAARLLDRALAGPGPASPRDLDRALVVPPDLGWVQLPGGKRVALDRHGPARRVLRPLVEHRLRSPGEALPTYDLVTAGWPGERPLPAAGAARVYVGLSRLRALGLRDLLLRREDGYLLDPRVEVVTTSGEDS